LIDINRLPLARVEELPAGKGVRIGALARNSDVAAHELIKSRYPVLSEAFLSGEVELLYQRAEWDRQAYEEFFDGARQRLEARYGRGTVLAEDNTPKGDVMQRLIDYEWQQQSGDIRLFFFR
jgi:hypothetical protein